ncbi:MAG: murein hydrolase activator EnvC family protein [Bacteroidia bacterium]|jgi:murein DD-endopeptidase MepM/ murein hydrolase activator NlpD
MKDKRHILKKLRDKYRLVILNDKTFEEKASIRLSRLNVFILLSVAIVLFAAALASIIVFTPVKEYIPGYADVGMRRDLVQLYQTVDSLERNVRGRDALLDNIRQVIDGTVGSETTDSLPTPDVGIRYEIGLLDVAAPFDSLLRLQMQRDMVEVRLGGQSDNRRFQGVSFFPPVTGQLVQRFSTESRNFGVGLVLSREDGIKATLEGTVVYSGVNLAEQQVIGIQHANNLMSWYKQMNQSLKKVGDFVRAGEVIGISGGEASGTRPLHVEFQLWYNGIPIDPARYINF